MLNLKIFLLLSLLINFFLINYLNFNLLFNKFNELNNFLLNSFNDLLYNNNLIQLLFFYINTRNKINT